MSIFSGPQFPGAMRQHRARKRDEALERESARLKAAHVSRPPTSAVVEVVSMVPDNPPHRVTQGYAAFCESCGKRGYADRRSARRAMRALHQSDKGMRPYWCPNGGDLWHIGHIPQVVRDRGTSAAADILSASYRQPGKRVDR